MLSVKCNLVFTFSRNEQENDAVSCVFMMPKLNLIYTSCGIVYIGLCWVILYVRGRLKDKITLSECISKNSKIQKQNYKTFQKKALLKKIEIFFIVKHRLTNMGEL